MRGRVDRASQAVCLKLPFVSLLSHRKTKKQAIRAILDEHEGRSFGLHPPPNSGSGIYNSLSAQCLEQAQERARKDAVAAIQYHDEDVAPRTVRSARATVLLLPLGTSPLTEEPNKDWSPIKPGRKRSFDLTSENFSSLQGGRVEIVSSDPSDSNNGQDNSHNKRATAQAA
jgi:hypothetical protein